LTAAGLLDSYDLDDPYGTFIGSPTDSANRS